MAVLICDESLVAQVTTIFELDVAHGTRLFFMCFLVSMLPVRRLRREEFGVDLDAGMSSVKAHSAPKVY